MEKVGQINSTHQDGRYYVEVNDFNPATHDVLIVAKDARRVWIERDSNGGQGMHLMTPYFSGVGWLSSGYEQLGFTVVSGLVADDLVEFVAIANHRSPVPKKPYDPNEPYKSVVLQRYPAAEARRTTCANTWYISECPGGCQISGHEPAQYMAWMSAAERIEDAAKERSSVDGDAKSEADLCRSRVLLVYPYAILLSNPDAFVGGWKVIDGNTGLCSQEWSTTVDDAWCEAYYVMIEGYQGEVVATSQAGDSIPTGCYSETVAAPVPSL